jgi:hypothetical protein
MEFEIFITAPNGCADAKVFLDSLTGINFEDTKVTILEYGPNCKSVEAKLDRRGSIEHRLFDEFSEMAMRKHSFDSSLANWLVYVEDHALPDLNFFSELRSYVAQDSPADAITFYSKNGTPIQLVREQFTIVSGLKPRYRASQRSLHPFAQPLWLRESPH